MSKDQFIGRGETLVSDLLTNPFSIKNIVPQCPIVYVIRNEDYTILDQEVKNHKFDFLVQRYGTKPDWVIEVNYKHGEKSARKWSEIFVPLIEKVGKIPVTINDYDCETLFKGTKTDHKNTWFDLFDLVNALKTSGAKI